MAEPLPPIAVYYEHPEWFRPLFAELDARGTPYVKVDAARHRFDPGAGGAPFALLFNRMSAWFLGLAPLACTRFSSWHRARLEPQ